MIKRKNTIIAALILGASLTMTGCSEADKVNYNMSKQADYFECERKITVYNARNDSENELVCTVKTGADEYRKNYIYLNDYTMYVVEDITGTHSDPYHYKMYFHTESLIDVDTRP